jgi:chitinase
MSNGKKLLTGFFALLLLGNLAGLVWAREKPRTVIAYVFARNKFLQAEEIVAERLTHINYAFANIQDGVIVEGFQVDRENYRILNSLKQRHPQLKILVSVGGWTWSGNFSDMALTRASRGKFNESVVAFLQTHHLDGIDIDWEYPGLPGYGNKHRPEDKSNFTALLKELRARLKKEERNAGHPFLITIAAGAGQDFLEHTEMKKAQRYLDLVNLMTYDFYEAGSDPTTGHHACLSTNPADPKKISAESAVQAMLRAGVPPGKLVLGVPFYGHAWGEVEPANHGLFQPGKEVRLATSYRELAANYENKSGFTRYWDQAASAPYLWNEARRIFISYEDPESLQLKCRYVLRKKLGGIMFWEYRGDSNQQLLGTIHNGLNGESRH